MHLLTDEMGNNGEHGDGHRVWWLVRGGSVGDMEMGWDGMGMMVLRPDADGPAEVANRCLPSLR